MRECEVIRISLHTVLHHRAAKISVKLQSLGQLGYISSDISWDENYSEEKTIIGIVPADDLPGVLPVAEHDGLVHDHSLGRLCLVTPGDPYDVEVRAGGKTKVRLDCIRQRE